MIKKLIVKLPYELWIAYLLSLVMAIMSHPLMAVIWLLVISGLWTMWVFYKLVNEQK